MPRWLRRLLGVTPAMLVMQSAIIGAAHAQEHVEDLNDRAPRFLLRRSPAPIRVDVDRTPVLQRRIALDLRGVTLADALREIGKASGLRIAYSRAEIPTKRPVRLQANDITVAAALTDVLLGAGVDVLFTHRGQAMIVRRTAVTGSIRGRVTDAKTGEGIQAATIEIKGTKLGALTGDDGGYTIANVPAGSYTLTARRIGYAKATHAVTVTAEHESVVDFALQKAATALEQVVVTGTIVPTAVKALPTPISVVTDSQIARRHPFSIGAIVRQTVPGAVSFSPPNVPDNTEVSVRGTTSLIHAGAMKVFIDGLEVSTFDLTPIDPSSIERIEIIRGPEAATIYGSDAATGVMQIFTKRGDTTATRPHTDAQLALGLAQTPYKGYGAVLRQQYTASMRGGGPGVSYNIGGSYMHLGDYVPDNGPTHESVPSVQGGMHFSRGIVTADLFGRYHATRAPLSVNPLVRATGYVPESRPDNLPITTNNEAYGTRVVVSPKSWWRNQLTLGIDRVRVSDVQTAPRFTTPDDTLLEVFDETIRKVSVGYNTSIIGAVSPSLTGSLTLGIDHYSRGVNEFFTASALNTDGGITTSPPGAMSQTITTVTNTGYFAQGQLGVRDALFFTVGVRAERNSNFGKAFGTAVLPRFGVSFVRPVGGTTIKLRTAYGRALRTPSAGEAASQVLPTSIQLANPDLGPEEQRGWDAGVDLVFGNRASLSVSGYDQTAIDLIAFLQTASVPVPTYKYQNVGRASNKGVEVEGTLELGPNAELRAQYAYVRSRIEEAGAAGGSVQAGDVPVLVPTHTAGASFTVTPREGTSVTAGVTYVGSFREYDTLAEFKCLGALTAEACPADFLSTFSTRAFLTTYSSFAKVNATVSHRFTRQIEAFLSIDNLTNNESYEFYNASPVMGRVTTFGLNLSY